MDTEKNRSIVMIDGDYFFALQKFTLGWFIDPALLLKHVRQDLGNNIVESRYYISHDENDNRQQAYLRALTFQGFSLIKRPLMIKDNERKLSVECDIVADMCLFLHRYDRVYLLAGTAEYASTVEKIRMAGKEVVVIASGKLGHGLQEVIGQSVLDVVNIRHKIEKIDEREPRDARKK